MRTLSVGVIGVGRWGANISRDLQRLPGCDLRAIADVNRHRLAAVRSQYPGIGASVHYHDLFGLGLDAIVVATPSDSHFRVGFDVLSAGIDVLIEKPLASSSADAMQLIQSAEDAGRVLMAGHVMEYHPSILQMKEIIGRGDIGRLLWLDAVRLNADRTHTQTDVLWDLAPHDISVANLLLGREPLEASAVSLRRNDNGELEEARVCLQYSDDVPVHMHMGKGAGHKVRTMTVAGEEFTIQFNELSPNKLRMCRTSAQSIEAAGTATAIAPGVPWTHVVPTATHISDALALELEHFLSAVRTRDRPRSDGWSGLRVVLALEAIENALRSKQPSTVYALTSP